MPSSILTEQDVWELLAQIPDPEIPVISLVELGVIRQVEVSGGGVTISISPTFSGCPALQVMQDDIRERLASAGSDNVTLLISHSPSWSTDWITPQGREKLKSFGISPPARHSGLIELALVQTATCPYCGSSNTQVKNEFGPTLCRAILYCNQCQQPFEQFKPL